MQTNEFRVRPVTRFVLTHYQQDAQQGGSLRNVGEFDNVEAAEEVGVAIQALVPGSTLTTIDGRQAAYPPPVLAAAMAVRTQPLLEFVIVQRGFETETKAKAYYAETRQEAEACQASAEKEFGVEFRIFERPVTDPVRIAARTA
jgi:hypothetical protein